MTKLPLGPRVLQRATQDIFDLQLKENPDEDQQLDVSNMLNDLRDSFDKNSTEYQFYNHVLEGLNLSIDNQAPTSILDQNIQLKERLDDGEEIIEDETAFLEVPQINNSISTPDVVSPIPLPEIASAPP